ncbi:MAG: PAS domain-containing protein [Burkholderiales bacterium]|nr:PAS domain-containing protein [Burkholderiales bacterium]
MAFNPNPLQQQLIDALERMVEGKPPPADEIDALIKALRFDQVIVEVRSRELSETQRTLEECKRRCAELYEQAPVAHVTLDEAGRICELNAAATALIGLPARKLCDSLFPARLVSGETDRFYQYLRLCRQQRAPLAGEFTLRVDNAARPIQLLGAPAISASGEWLCRAVLIDITPLRIAEQQLQQCEARLRILLSRPPEYPKEDDDGNLASELHDQLCPALAALDSDIAWLSEKLDNCPPEVLDKLLEMARVVTDSADAVRHAGEQLRSLYPEYGGLAASINRYAAQFEKQHDIICALDLDLAGIELEIEPANALLHIVKEAMANVARHAGASQVTVRGRCEDDAFVLAVEDDGRGFDEEKLRERGSHVLRNILQRAQSIGGSVRIKSRRGAGSTITISIPLSRLAGVSRHDRKK